MGIAVLTEPVEGGYRAASGPPLEAEVIAQSREEAKNRLMELLSSRMQHGVEVDTVEFPTNGAKTTESIARFLGDMRDSPLFDDWQDAMKVFRKERDAQTEW